MESEQLLSIRNFGPRSLTELMESLEEHNYNLPSPLIGMEIEENSNSE
jgi:DNA-directed RNA polymerase alpha subunit